MQSLQRRAPALLFLWQGVHRLVKFSPQVCPAANHPDLLRQPVVTGVPVRMEPACKAFEKLLGILRFSALLVFIQNDGVLRIPAGPVQPHVTLVPGSSPLQLQHL